MSAPVVTTRGLRIGYRQKVVADIPDLALGPRCVWLVTGPNGSGKSTLLKTLARLLPSLSGAVTPAIPRGAGGVVFVHSTSVLFRGTVRHNLRLTAEDASAVERIARRFGLTDRLEQRVHELSHGMRQRTALARAILARPAVLLLDEPEGGLDESALHIWQSFVADVIQEGSLTLVVAAHRPAGLEGVPTKTIALR